MRPGARFARRSELRARLRPTEAAWFPLGYLPTWPRAVGAWRRLSDAPVPRLLRGPLLCLPNADLARHVLVTGLTGAHKTTALTLPVLLEAARAGVSVVAFDLKYAERDSLAGAAPEWWRNRRDVLVFAPLDSATLRWNPLAACRSFAAAYDFAVQLFPDGPSEEADPAYWTGAERHVCAVLAWALCSDEGGRSVSRLRALAEAGPEAVSAYARRHPQASNLALRLGAYRAMLPKDQAGILQGIAARLDPWADERVSRATVEGHPAGSWDEIDLARLRREPTLLLVGVPQAALPRLRVLCHVFMRTLAAFLLLPRGPEHTVPVLFVLEELPAWGPLPGLADHLATFRSRDVAIFATVQSDAQGEAVYGSAGWAAITANFVSKIYFPSLADPDAARLSRALGTAVVNQVSRSRGWGGAGRQESEQTRAIEVPLRRPESLQGVDAFEDEIVVRCPRLPPARLWCPPFHARPEYRALVPDVPPHTIDIAIRHRLVWQWRKTGRSSDCAPFSRPLLPVTAPLEPAPSPLGAVAAAPSSMAAAQSGDLEDDGVHDDRSILCAFVDALLDRGGADDPRVRVVCRGSRPAEARVDSALAFRLLGGGDRAQATIVRWAALRWVKRVRPVFVLERRALEILSRDLQDRLITVERMRS
ncbi:MAG TPA: type IV secretory system conjugative DNA transfer family protein [bacterium]|nr:type IV secretory system conjugative DNA transfer family protein [bacterium]